MATLDLYLVIAAFICRFCTAIVHSNVLDLERKIKDDFAWPSSLHSSEPGLALFHTHQLANISILSDLDPLPHTLGQDGHIENLTLSFVAFGKRFLVDLHKVRDLFSSSYTRKILHYKGKHLRKSIDSKEHCYYQGQLRGNPSSTAALSSCSGFSGYISDGQETYHIDPVNGALHRIFRNSDRKKLPFKCGFKGHSHHHHSPDRFSSHVRKKRSLRGPYDANKSTRYVELYIVNDYRTYNRYGKNATLVFKRSQNIANIVNSLYRQLNIYVVLVGVEVWSTGDKISITPSADTTMENFLRYRKERINPFHVNDNAQLITGIIFDHGVVGKAIKGPICTHQFSGGVSMDYDGLVTLVATTMAHEMGHNFGMEHDNETTCSCPQDKCIMAATSGKVSPEHWSSCSQNALHEAFELGMDYCLRNLPQATFQGPLCGNGLVEDGEECDCGLPEDCSNRCCNATNCTLYAQAECGSGRCCDLSTCKPKGSSSLCREPRGECDLPEHCDGSSEFCPPDVYLQDGQECGGGQSYCYKGRCNTHNSQCQLLWGSTGRVSDPICFQQLNIRGDHDGNCGYNWTTDRYHNCERENVMCGLLHCVHLNEKLMFWRDNLALDMRASFLTRGNTQYVCRSTMLDVGLDMPDPGLVPDGAKCEQDKICIKQTCTPLMKLKILKCPDCNDNGVCNSNGNCHCDVGYAPPLCDKPGYGGSLDSGPVTNEYSKQDLLIGLLILFLVILPLCVLGVLAYINRRRLLVWWKQGPGVKFGVLKKSQSPPQPPQPRPSASFTEKRWSAAPSRPNTTLDISGPLMDEPPSYDSCEGDTPTPSSRLVPPPPARPIFKPSAVPPKLNPPAAGRTPTLTSSSHAAVPAVAIAGREQRSFLSKSSTSQPPQPAAEKKPALETARSSWLNSSVGESTLKRQQREREAKRERPAQSPPTSPTKGERKIVHSQSMREAGGGRDQLGVGDKIVKRESFRGAEISSPILVSTTNRDSQVFADFELDESGIVARPIAKQHSIHGSNPAAEVARDGCRSPVRRSQSERKGDGGATDGVGAKKGAGGQGFTPRPLPPEPVLETEPLYINEGLSDLEDLKAHISSAFEGFSLPSSGPAHPPAPSSAKPAAASAVSSSLLSRASLNPVSSAATTNPSKSSTSSSGPPLSKPTQPASIGVKASPSSAGVKASPSSAGVKASPSNAGVKASPSSAGVKATVSSTGAKATALERVLNNPIKQPFSSSLAGSTTTSAPTSTAPTAGGKSVTSASGAAKTASTPGSKPSPSSSTPASSSQSTVRGPFGTTLKKTSASLGADSNKGSGVSPGSGSSAASSSAGNKWVAGGSGASKGPGASWKSPGSTGSSTTGSLGRGQLRSLSNASSSKPALSSTSKLSSNTPSAANKAPSSSSSSAAASSTGSASRGPAATTTSSSSGSKPSGAVGSAGTPASRVNSAMANLQRSVSAASSRPAVAPKPSSGKSVRSYNF